MFLLTLHISCFFFLILKWYTRVPTSPPREWFSSVSQACCYRGPLRQACYDKSGEVGRGWQRAHWRRTVSSRLWRDQSSSRGRGGPGVIYGSTHLLDVVHSFGLSLFDKKIHLFNLHCRLFLMNISKLNIHTVLVICTFLYFLSDYLLAKANTVFSYLTPLSALFGFFLMSDAS